MFLGQNLSDATLLATNNYVKRAGTPSPSNSGQAGVAVKHIVEDWGTEFGLYAAQFHSRASFYSAIKSLRVGVPYVPGDPGDLNPQYFTEFPEDIRLYGATFNTRFRGGAVFGEITYRPQPAIAVQLGGPDKWIHLIDGPHAIPRAGRCGGTRDDFTAGSDKTRCSCKSVPPDRFQGCSTLPHLV